MENQNKKINTWKYIRQRGFADYVWKKMFFLGIMMTMIYIMNVSTTEGMHYILTAVIYIAIVILTPILSWKINEWNYTSQAESEENEVTE